jgi:O-antigen/teichoic acid export membrane protein
VVFFSSGLIADFFKKNISSIIQLVSILIFTSGIKLVYQTSFETVADFKKLVFFQIIDSISKLFLLAVLFFFVGKSVELIFLAMILSDIFTIFARATKIPSEIKTLLKERNTDKSLIIQTLKSHGKWALLNSQIKNLEANIPIWIVEHVLGVKWAGVYFAITKFYSILAKFFEPLDTIFYPLVAKLGGLKNSKNIIIRATKYVFYFSIPLIIFIILFGVDWFLKTIPDKNIQENANALKIFILIIFTIILNTPYKPIIFNLKQQKALTGASILVLIISVLTGYFLTMKLHIIGIAISRLISAVIDLFSKIVIIKKSIKTFSIVEVLLPDKVDFDLLKKIFYKIQKLSK